MIKESNEMAYRRHIPMALKAPLKKVLIFILFSTLALTSTAQEQSFIVNAKVATATEINQGSLLYYVNSQPVMLKAKLVNGVYHFQGKAPGPVLATFCLDDRRVSYAGGKTLDKISLRLENGTIDIMTGDSVKFATIKGGQYNKDFQKFKTFMAAEDNVLTNLNAIYNIGLQNKISKALIDTILQKRVKAAAARKVRLSEYVKRNPNSYSSIDAMLAMMGAEPDLALLQDLYKELSVQVKQTPAGKRLSGAITAIEDTRVGSLAAEFSLPDTIGNIIRLKDFRGKYLLLDFWASWCGPCRAENPNYLTNYKKYRASGFEMLGVSLDQKDEKNRWVSAIRSDGLLWPQVSELQYWGGEVNKLYRIKLIPQNFLIDPNGKIIAINLRGAELGKKLSEIFEK